MKTIKLLTLTMVLLMAITTTGKSEENEVARKKAVSQLNSDIKELFKEMPFEEVMCNERECELSLCFNVNEEGIIEFYHILSKNSELAEYSKELFADNELKLEKDLFNDDFYWIKLKIRYIK